MATRTNTAPSKSSKSNAVAGHSAATGRFILRPVSKGSSITVREASKAAKDAQGKTK